MGVIWHLPVRLATGAASAGIVLAMLGGVAPVSAGSPITDPAGVAAGWTAVKVEAGGLGAGSLADAIFAFAGAHAGATAAGHALTQLASKADAYIGYPGSPSPGALAKVMLAVIVAGGNPNSFNGHDLEADLRGLLVTSGPDAGRFAGAYVNDQSLAILALADTSGGVPADAGGWLASKQCTDGQYSWNGDCPVAAGAEDPDTTAIAEQALAAAGSTAAADKAVQWLLDQQAANGSLAGYGTPNSQSTALAAQALRAAGHAAAADAGEAFVASLQFGCSAAAANRGAIPYSATDPGYGGPYLSTVQGVLAFGAPRLDHLTLEGATAAAPTIQCAAATPGPTGGVLPTVPPTDAVAAPTAGGTSSAAALLLAVFAVASCALALARRPGRRS